MVIGCCTNCKYIDLIDDRNENTCLRCSGIMVSLGVNSDEWNKLSNEEMGSLINSVISEGASKNSGEDETSSSPKEASLDIPNQAHDLSVIPQIDEISTSCGSDVSELSYQLKPDEPDKSREPITPLPTIKKKTSTDAPLPTVKNHKSANTSTAQIYENDSAYAGGSTPAKRVKSVSANPNATGQRHNQVQSNNRSYNMVGADVGTSIFRVVAVIIAITFIILCLARSSSLGGLAAIASIIIPFRTIFMNGYDMFEDTHISIKYIVWGVLIVISLVGVITSA